MMRKLKYKRVNPKTENDFLEIEMNWFDVDPGINFYHWGMENRYDEFCEWAGQNCEGRWHWFRYYKNKDAELGGNRICFSDPADRIKFILRWM